MEKKYFLFKSPHRPLVYGLGADTIENAIQYFNNSNAKYKLEYQMFAIMPQEDADVCERTYKDFEYL